MCEDQPCKCQHARFEHSLCRCHDVVQFRAFHEFLWYFLASTVATPLTLAPARETAARGILTGRPMSVLKVATLDISEVQTSV